MASNSFGMCMDNYMNMVCIFFYCRWFQTAINLYMCYGFSKNCLIEKVLLSTHTMFWLDHEMKKSAMHFYLLEAWIFILIILRYSVDIITVWYSFLQQYYVHICCWVSSRVKLSLGF